MADSSPHLPRLAVEPTWAESGFVMASIQRHPAAWAFGTASSVANALCSNDGKYNSSPHGLL
jgi:hypothetical protein